MSYFSGVKNELNRLGALRDSVYLEGMSEEEICALEAVVGMSVPPVFREYFREVGLTQDLTYSGSDEALQLHTTSSEIQGARWHLCNLFGDEAAAAFPLGRDRSNRELAVVKALSDELLVEFDPDSLDITPRQLFSDWFAGVVSLAIERAANLTPNTRKRRYVQFVFRTDDEVRLCNALSEVADFEKLGTWEDKKRLSSGVTTSTLHCALAGHKLAMNLAEYENWTNPTLSFDFSEPVLTPKQKSLLWRLDRRFRNTDMGYSMVDYGLANGQGAAGRGFWLIVGLVCLAVYWISRVKYTVIGFEGGSVFIIQDNKTHDSIRNELMKRRKAQLLSLYGEVDLENDLEREKAKFEYLCEQGVISKEEANAKIRQASSAQGAWEEEAPRVLN